MAFDPRALFSAVVSPAMRSGLFDRVIEHEPKSKPGLGISLAVWTGSITPVPRASGLAATTLRLPFYARIYISMLAEPQDGIDPDLLEAEFALMGAWSAGFTLGGLALAVDLLGAYGTPLSSAKGYIQHDDTLYRISEITCPVILDDVFAQGA